MNGVQKKTKSSAESKSIGEIKSSAESKSIGEIKSSAESKSTEGFILRTPEEKKAFRSVQVRNGTQILSIFIMALLMPVISYILCGIAMMVYFAIQGKGVQHSMNAIGKVAASSGNDMMMILSLVASFLNIILCGILYRKSKWRLAKVDYKSIFCGKTLLALFVTGAGGCVFLTLFLSLLQKVIPGAFEAYNQIMEEAIGTVSIFVILYAGVFGPIAEELIFRGAIFDRTKVIAPFWIANIVQAALFGLYHMQWIQGLYAFCIGLALGLIYQATGSIFANIAVHILFNSTSLLLGAINLQVKWQMVTAIGCAVILLLGLPISLWYFYRRHLVANKKGI